MYVLKTNHYTFNEEEKKILRQAHGIFDKLLDDLFYSADDYYELDDWILNREDIEIIRNSLFALVEAQEIVTHDHVIVAD